MWWYVVHTQNWNAQCESGNHTLLVWNSYFCFNSVGSSTNSQTPQPGALTSISAGLPALPTKLLHKVWANEYIDFSELPPAKSKQRSLPHYLEGRVLLAQMHKLDNSKKAIPDFTTWAQCSALYSAALLQKQPDRAADLMAYLFATANNARKHRWPSWVVYDQNFRQLMAETQDKMWAKTDPSFFTRCFIHAQKSQDSWCRHCHSIEHTAIECPYITPHPEARRIRRLPPKNLRRALYVVTSTTLKARPGCR